MSSSYPVLDNRPIDQWKVTELKEELKRRKLTVKGLKEDLIKRLDEAIRNEEQSAEGDTDNDFGTAPQPEVQTEQATVEPSAKDIEDSGNNFIDQVDGSTPEIETDDRRGIPDKGKLVDDVSVEGSDSVQVETEQVTRLETGETVGSVTEFGGQPLNSNETEKGNGDLTVPVDDGDTKSSPQEDAKLNLSDSNSQASDVSESGVSVVPLSGSDAQNHEVPSETRKSEMQLEIDGSKLLHTDAKFNPSDINYQVSEVNSELRVQVNSDSVSTESVSINEKNELKVDIVINDVKFLEVKPDGGESYPMDVEESRDNKLSLEETGDGSAKNVDALGKNDTGKFGSMEKLSLDQNSVDDSMEEDILESRQMGSKSNFYVTREKGETSGMLAMKEDDQLENKSIDSQNNFDEMTESVVKEDDHVDIVGDDKTAESLDSNGGNDNDLALTSVKRKSVDQGAVRNSDVIKRQRRWNSEALKVPEPTTGNIVDSITPKDPVKTALKRSFSRSDSTVSEETPKERVVPPSAKPPTSALRIDNFLRPFTLKAVQELLGKAGTVTNFWMDHIKTHCYVSYSSVEEAVETRNAIYNLQWPPNGGRLLVAEFVDPQDVKTRVEAPLVAPATPSGSAPSNFPPAQPAAQLQQPSPRQQVQRQHFPPPPSLPPPPPLANVPHTKERPQLEREPAHREQPLPARERLNLPPPPPLAEKADPPIVTLDDLFRKTKTTPRIYYLPLSDEQVAEKLKAEGKNAKQ